ncbi:EF-hand domain-containing family member C2-like isoform X2 [Cylas formicarius]|nr:EF-hand domain-containing family member C2-like isoform X2 [Cylas formicarius]
MAENFYDLIDFNIGREVELYGKVFKIINCDKFTRTFLNRRGIHVPDPIVAPEDPYLELRSHDRDSIQPKKPNRTQDNLGKFLENDKKVLRFKAYWDDSETEYGYVHRLDVRYYCADDTIEVKELQKEAGGEPDFMFLRREKLPKWYRELPPVGSNSRCTVLNVLGSALGSKRYILDPLDCGRENTEYYTEKDLTIGGMLNCYGRKIILTDCDSFTKEYYAVKYGITEFNPIAEPNHESKTVRILEPKDRELPPWNGFGSYEDSAQNCLTVEPKPPQRDFKKFLLHDRVGLDSHILRFQAKMKSKIPENCSRNFIISYYLTDDSLGVFEIALRNSGFVTSTFFKKARVQLAGQKTYTSKPPLYYTPQHMYIGATLIINGFEFILTTADDYALRYMELNAGQFPKSNLKLIMDKVRDKLRPIYKDFVAEIIPTESSVIPYEKLRNKLCQIMGEDFTEHEMITIARGFSASCYKQRYDRDKIRAIVLTQLKRYLWDDLDRLREYFLLRDHSRSGKLSEKECYTILKGSRLPFENELINKIIDVIEKDDHGNIEYENILRFLDRTICPMPDSLPINIKLDLGWGSEPRVEAGKLIDWCAFNKCLDLESTFRNTVGEDSVKAIEDKTNLAG